MLEEMRTNFLETHNDILRGLLLTTLVVFASPSSGVSQAKKAPEFFGGDPYYEIKTSKFGNRYFVTWPGPCACLVSDPIIHCSKDLQKDLAEQLEIKKQMEKIECLPNAGCSLGQEHIYAECPPKKKK